MLKGINPILSPELLKTLAEMGHGDEIILADAHFPGHTFCKNTIRYDGIHIPNLLEGILPLFELDSYDDPLIMMDAVDGDELDPSVEEAYLNVINKYTNTSSVINRIDRFSFYERAQKAFCCVITGSIFKYGNIILKKGVISS